MAEGVETEGQVAILRELGADVGQGYFFAAPLGGDEAQELTERGRPPPLLPGRPAAVVEDGDSSALPEIDLDNVTSTPAGRSGRGSRQRLGPPSVTAPRPTATPVADAHAEA